MCIRDRHADDPRLQTGESGIVMLAAEWCGYCRKQQKDFELAGVRYRVPVSYTHLLAE